VATSVLSKVYPVVGGTGAVLATRGALEVARNVAVGRRSGGRTSKPPPGRGGGGAAWVWTALSWTVSVGVGACTARRLVRHPSPGGTSAELQPAQS